MRRKDVEIQLTERLAHALSFAPEAAAWAAAAIEEAGFGAVRKIACADGTYCLALGRVFVSRVHKCQPLPPKIAGSS